MHICLVSLDYKPYRSSGLTLYAEDLARGLQELGQEVSVIAARRPGLPSRHYVEGVPVFRLPIGAADWLGYGWRVSRFLDHEQDKIPFQVLHFLDVHFAYACHEPFVASLWQSFRQRLTARNGSTYSTGPVDRVRRELYYRAAQKWMERPSLERAGRLVASCTSTRQEFIQHYHVPPAKIDLALQGIDTEFFLPVPAEQLRTRLGLDGYQVLLFTGFITPRKGLEYLGAALQLLPERVHLVIIGRWEAGYRKRFLEAVGPAIQRVHEVGFVPDEERPSYYSMADVYVSPSLLEGLGITPVEAMACGTPAVVTSASSGPEEVGETGLIVPPCDPQALAEAIRTLLEDDPLRRRLSQCGRERALSMFSYRKMAELTLGSYYTFLGSKDAAP